MQTQEVDAEAEPPAVEEAGEEASGEKDGQRSVMDVLVDARWLAFMPAQAPQVCFQSNRLVYKPPSTQSAVLGRQVAPQRP